MGVVLRLLRFSAARWVALRLARSPAARRSFRGAVRRLGRRRLLRLAWRLARL